MQGWLGILILFSFWIYLIFCMSGRDASERIADLDLNQPVTDIVLVVRTYCWWCICNPWARLAPRTCWVKTRISGRWYMAKCLERPAWCPWHSALTACWLGHWGSGRWLCISGRPSPAATPLSLCPVWFGSLRCSPEAEPLKPDTRT